MSTSEGPEARLRALAQSPEPSARERILTESFVLFYTDGIRAVGVDLLIARSDVAKATFYRHFASKSDLVVAYLDRRRRAMLDWLAEEVAVRPGPPLLAVFDALGELFADPAFRGCPVHNAVVEAGTDSAAVRERAVTHAAELSRYIAGLATASGLDAGDLAPRWVLLIDGAFVGAQRGEGREAAAVARRAAELLLAGVPITR
ncbi:MAG TPA: TetR/AcrR family transcriptional regulator [Mycobacteriales bacterium]|jgi:AcrR family transcriptional regulator|nr:TetR/AcrR family transcriptional regulator [Mycobacteriales bacterium]